MKTKKEITRKMNSGTWTPGISLPCAKNLARSSAMIYTMVKMPDERIAIVFFIKENVRGLTRIQ
jgi:hypothetical protein